MKLKGANRAALAVTTEMICHGNACLKIGAGGDYIMLVAPRQEMIGELKRWLRSLEVRSVTEVEQSQALPVELYKPETAWPWLVEHFPWVFDGINTKTEPYAHYLSSSVKTKSQAACDVCGEPVTGVTAKYCSNRCRQAAYRERKAA